MFKHFWKLIFAIFFTLLIFDYFSLSASAKQIEGMQGQSVPTGTIALASSSDSGNQASFAIDGDISTYWNSAGTSASLTLNFPYSVHISSIQLMPKVYPSTNVTYTVYGLEDNQWVKILDKTSVYVKRETTGEYSVLSPFEVKTGLYSGIKIEADAGTSWVAIRDISIDSANIQNLTASGNDSSVSLSWPPLEAADSYTIYYGTTSDDYTESLKVTQKFDGSYIVPNLKNGTTYYFVVTSIINNVESAKSNEANATPQGNHTEPEGPIANTRALLTVTMVTGLEKEYDLSMKEVNDFLNWYDNKDTGNGSSRFEINKHSNNIGPFSKRTDSLIFSKILTFEVSEYSVK